VHHGPPRAADADEAAITQQSHVQRPDDLARGVGDEVGMHPPVAAIDGDVALGTTPAVGVQLRDQDPVPTVEAVGSDRLRQPDGVPHLGRVHIDTDRV
jgi:hypothetical protein